MNKINIDQTHLQLNVLDLSDTFEELVDKFNMNFNEIQENGGGPMGPVGPQGNSIPGPPGPVGPKGEDGDSEWSRLDGVNGCSIDLDIDIEDSIPNIENLANTYSNKKILLTNLINGEESVADNTSLSDDIESSSVVNATCSNYKFKLYNSTATGAGEHIHLMNSQLASLDSNYLCESGFSVSDDRTGDAEETLRIHGHKNPNIANHGVKIQIIADHAELKNNLNGQGLRFKVEEVEDITVVDTKTNTYLLTTQSKDNTTRLPDRTGWNAVWEDTITDNETWDVVYKDITLDDADEIIIDRIKYNNGGETPNILYDSTHTTVTQPIIITDNSYIRFKRLNNWVLIDYRMEINNTSTTPIRIKDIVFKVNTPSVGCRTISYHPGTYIVEDKIDRETDNYFHHFKIESSTFDLEKTFKIINKFSSTPLIIDDTNKQYFISGQVWATIEEFDPVCEVLQIIAE
jgi:hypothetical protein